MSATPEDPPPDHRTSALQRRFRNPRALWLTLPLLLGGPLNPGILVGDALSSDDLLSHGQALLVLAYALPCTLLALSSTISLARLRYFTAAMIWRCLAWRLLAVVLIAPLLTITQALLTGPVLEQVTWNALFLAIAMYPVAFLTGFVPLIALFYGVPAALVLAGLLFVATTPDS